MSFTQMSDQLKIKISYYKLQYLKHEIKVSTRRRSIIKQKMTFITDIFVDILNRLKVDAYQGNKVIKEESDKIIPYLPLPQGQKKQEA